MEYANVISVCNAKFQNMLGYKFTVFRYINPYLIPTLYLAIKSDRIITLWNRDQWYYDKDSAVVGNSNTHPCYRLLHNAVSGSPSPLALQLKSKPTRLARDIFPFALKENIWLSKQTADSEDGCGWTVCPSCREYTQDPCWPRDASVYRGKRGAHIARVRFGTEVRRCSVRSPTGVQKVVSATLQSGRYHLLHSSGGPLYCQLRGLPCGDKP